MPPKFRLSNAEQAGYLEGNAYYVWQVFLFETPLQITVTFRYADIRVALLPLDTFNDGRWYKMSDSERARLNPVLINNNWIIGKVYHYSCQKTNGNYFEKKRNT